MPAQLKVLEISKAPGDAQTMYVGQTFDLVKDSMTIGRHSKNDIPLYYFDRARYHGLLHRDGDGHILENIANGGDFILVNNTPIKEPTLLSDGDEVTFFWVKFVYLKNNKSEPDLCSSFNGTTQ